MRIIRIVRIVRIVRIICVICIMAILPFDELHVRPRDDDTVAGIELHFKHPGLRAGIERPG
ncbi:MAG: hypothetical protein V3T24_01580, partial [Longimicrobiales bacterium]